MTPKGPTEEDSHYIADTGYSGTVIAEQVVAYKESIKQMTEAVLARGGFYWQLIQQNVLHTEPPLNNMTSDKCTALFRKLCVPSPVGHMRMQMYNIEIGRKPNWNTPLGTATFTANTIEFLLTRGPYALLGYAWDGCFAAPTPRAKEWTMDVGEPVASRAGQSCFETAVGSGVFAREWTKANITWSCHAQSGAISLKTDDESDTKDYGAAPRVFKADIEAVLPPQLEWAKQSLAEPTVSILIPGMLSCFHLPQPSATSNSFLLAPDFGDLAGPMNATDGVSTMKFVATAVHNTSRIKTDDSRDDDIGQRMTWMTPSRAPDEISTRITTPLERTVVTVDWTHPKPAKVVTSAQIEVDFMPFLSRSKDGGDFDGYYEALSNLGAEYMRFSPWFGYPKVVVPELEKTECQGSAWNSTLMDQTSECNNPS
eukprot:SAG22_NODE_1605_length_4014_cov_1.785696_1_plen_426_part_00